MNKHFSWVTIVILMVLTSCSNETISPLKPQDTKLVREIKSTSVINQTFLGNEHRNFYGYNAPDKLDILWETFLGTGYTNVSGKMVQWSGAGWTGQPLMIKQDNELYIIQGTYEHSLKKIRVSDGKIMGAYMFNNVIKGTGTIWTKYDTNGNIEDFYILQGSRRGNQFSNSSPVVESYQCVRFSDMKGVWKYNSKKMRSYSRDVDGSAVIVNDTAYLGLENGLFMAFNPDPDAASLKDGITQPQVFHYDTLYYDNDALTHGGNLVTESSPTHLNGHIYVTSGAGHVFGYNIAKKQIDWVFDTGADMDGSPVVTNDSCFIISIEKEYIPGKGGVMKIDPTLPPDQCVKWYFPTQTVHFAWWDGGVIGTVGVSDFYNDTLGLAVFVAIDGYLYVVDHNKIDFSKTATGPMLKHEYPTPELVFKYETGPSISSPIIVGNKIIAATYNGVYLFEFDENLNFKLLDHQELGSFEATPFVWDKKVFVASRNGQLYCFGEK